jgi:hypothetical protein
MPQDPQNSSNRKRRANPRSNSLVQENSTTPQRDQPDVAKQRLDFLKDRLVTLYKSMQQVEVPANEAKLKALLLQDEVSELIWILEDWQVQAGARN